MINKCDGEVSYHDRDGNQRIRVCGKDDLNYLQSQRDEASWNVWQALKQTYRQKLTSVLNDKW